MPWMCDDGKSPYGNEPANYAEKLCDDEGNKIGYILQFYKNGPYYGGSESNGRTGPMRDLDYCRRKVEELACWRKDK